jgi:hypothetical protein
MTNKALQTIIKNHATAAMLVGIVGILGSAGAVRAASLSINPIPGTTETWKTESGQSMPTATGGYFDGTLYATAGTYTFIFGGFDATGLGLVAGQTGYGNSTDTNEFWVGTSEASAEAAGDVFCNHPDASCGGGATAVGTQFAISMAAAGDIQFGFTFGPTTSYVLLNGGTSIEGAYLAQIGTGTTASAGPGSIAYLGLTDGPYPGDHDFQDMVVTVQATPEPTSLLLFGGGLLALAFCARRRRNPAE